MVLLVHGSIKHFPFLTVVRLWGISGEYKTRNFTEIILPPAFTYRYLKQCDVDRFLQSSLIVTQTHTWLRNYGYT